MYSARKEFTWIKSTRCDLRNTPQSTGGVTCGVKQLRRRRTEGGDRLSLSLFLFLVKNNNNNNNNKGKENRWAHGGVETGLLRSLR